MSLSAAEKLLPQYCYVHPRDRYRSFNQSEGRFIYVNGHEVFICHDCRNRCKRFDLIKQTAMSSTAELQVLTELLLPSGIKFIAQFRLDRYSYDFAFPQWNSLVEVDGKGHDRSKTAYLDVIKTRTAERYGWHLYRVAAGCQMLKRFDLVIEAMKSNPKKLRAKSFQPNSLESLSPVPFTTSQTAVKGCGVYGIRHTVTNRYYVGSSGNVQYRLRKHLCALKTGGEHHAKHLQHAWNKYGQEAFDIVLLESVADFCDLNMREQYWIDKLEAVVNGFNTSNVSGRATHATLPTFLADNSPPSLDRVALFTPYTSGPGVYAFCHLDSGRYYVSSAVDVQGRVCKDLAQLRMGRHHFRHFQNAWSKYGEEAFQAVLLEPVQRHAQLPIRQQAWATHLSGNLLA